jgi:hypothetical protein
MAHKCLIISPRDSDYIAGISSPIPFKAAVPSGDWTQYDVFFERQKFAWDTDGCVIFTAQESFDAQMDYFISSGQISAGLLGPFMSMGYMDANSSDGKPHFHSSPRFLQILTGNGFNGNPLPAPWDAMRKYGCLPWTDLPFDSSMSPQEYILASSITPEMYSKAAQFLSLIGGKNSVQYHWIINNDPTNLTALQAARQQAPVCLGIAVDAGGWNVIEPPIATGAPAHSVQNYNQNSAGEMVLDHYVPFDKILQFGYPINYALQGVLSLSYTPPISPNPTPVSPQPPSAPTLPPQANISQIRAFLAAAAQWLQNILVSLKGVFTKP